MRYLLLFFAMLSAVSFLAAQQRPAPTSPRQEEVIDPKKQAAEQLATHLALLRKACDEGHVETMRYYQSAVLMHLRLDIEAAEQAVAAGRPASPNLNRQRAILDAFEGFYFQPGQSAEAAPKFALLEEYRAMER